MFGKHRHCAPQETDMQGDPLQVQEETAITSTSSHAFSLLCLTTGIKWRRTVWRQALQITTRILRPHPANVPQPCSKPSIAIHSFTPHGSARYHHLLLQTELYPPTPATKFTSWSPDPNQGCTRSKEETNRKSGP